MAAPSYEKTKRGYANMWRSMKVTRISEADAAARRILADKPRYQAVENKTGVPWFFIAILHMRESSNDFRGVLHNGEHIIGTGRKTKLVPAGRGPFETWEDAAIDALKIKNLHKLDWSTELISRIGYHGEAFNGWGYTNRGVNSPYLWAGSSHQQPGKYVADGKWSSTTVDKQMGIMPVLARIAELDQSVAARIEGQSAMVNPTAKGMPPAATAATSGAVIAAGAGAVAATTTGLPWAVIVPLALIAGSVVFVLIYALTKAQRS